MKGQQRHAQNGPDEQIAHQTLNKEIQAMLAQQHIGNPAIAEAQARFFRWGTLHIEVAQHQNNQYQQQNHFCSGFRCWEIFMSSFICFIMRSCTTGLAKFI